MGRSSLLMAVVALAGCLIVDRTGDGVLRVACLGDSNTARGWPTPERVRWCEYAAAHFGGAVEFRNYGGGGGTFCPIDHIEWPAEAHAQLARALADAPDLIVAAFATNDVVVGFDAATIAGCATAIRRASPVPVVVATMPPRVEYGREVREVNRALRRLGGALVDFTSGTAGALEADGVHLTDSAQYERAARVAAVLYGN